MHPVVRYPSTVVNFVEKLQQYVEEYRIRVAHGFENFSVNAIGARGLFCFMLAIDATISHSMIAGPVTVSVVF